MDRSDRSDRMDEALARPTDALDALRDADRLVYVAQTTFVQELADADLERRGRTGWGGFDLPVIGLGASVANGGRDGDAVTAQRELGEAEQAIKQAILALPRSSAVQTRLVNVLRDEHPSFMARAAALGEAVRSAHHALRAGDPTLAAAHAELPSWGVDADDRAIARAAGAHLSVAMRSTAAGVVVIAVLVGLMCGRF